MSPTSLVVRAALALALSWWGIRQCRKPIGWLGNFVLKDMNKRHSELTSWGLANVSVRPTDKILDIGCGGGRTLQKLAALASMGKVDGVDYSKAAVQVSQSLNQAAIDSGRIAVQQASVSRLPFKDTTFDLITAVETHYYWPNLVTDLREIRRVLKPHGSLLIIAEAYRGRTFDAAYRSSMKLLGGIYLTPQQHRQILEEAGFGAVQIVLDQSKGWICAIAQSGESRAES